MPWCWETERPEVFLAGDAIVLGADLLAGLLILQIPLWIAKIVFRWRLVDPSGTFPSPQEERQFQIKHMLVAMFLLSVALSPVHKVLPAGPMGHIPIGPQFFVGIGLVIVCNLLVTIPCLWGAFVSTAKIIPLAFGWLFYCCLLTGIEFGSLCALLHPPSSKERAEAFGVFCLLNLSQCITVFGTLLIYRAMGFRLLRRPRVACRYYPRGQGGGVRIKDKG